jgi:hypothetical protein
LRSKDVDNDTDGGKEENGVALLTDVLTLSSDDDCDETDDEDRDVDEDEDLLAGGSDDDDVDDTVDRFCG